MKRGIFIYQEPPMIGRNVIISDAAFTNFSFMNFGKGKKFLDALQSKLEELEYPVTVAKDDTEANLDRIVLRNYDFVICAPGLQNKILLKEELPQIFYLTSSDYFNSLVSNTINMIKNNVL